MSDYKMIQGWSRMMKEVVMTRRIGIDVSRVRHAPFQLATAKGSCRDVRVPAQAGGIVVQRQNVHLAGRRGLARPRPQRHQTQETLSRMGI